MDIWEPRAGPAAVRDTHSVDEWLTLVAAGPAVGMTSEATVAQYPRPGVVYRPVRDVPPVQVWPARQAMLQPPQLPTSELVSTQFRLQLVCPGAHEPLHRPSLQT